MTVRVTTYAIATFVARQAPCHDLVRRWLAFAVARGEVSPRGAARGPALDRVAR